MYLLLHELSHIEWVSLVEQMTMIQDDPLQESLTHVKSSKESNYDSINNYLSGKH